MRDFISFAIWLGGIIQVYPLSVKLLVLLQYCIRQSIVIYLYHCLYLYLQGYVLVSLPLFDSLPLSFLSILIHIYIYTYPFLILLRFHRLCLSMLIYIYLSIILYLYLFISNLIHIISNLLSYLIISCLISFLIRVVLFDYYYISRTYQYLK